MLLDGSNDRVQKVKRLAMHILESNQTSYPDVDDQDWAVTVVDITLKNAMVMAGGRIYFCRSDDEPAHIICHEKAHALMSHSPELMSKNLVTELLVMPLVEPL